MTKGVRRDAVAREGKTYLGAEAAEAYAWRIWTLGGTGTGHWRRREFGLSAGGEGNQRGLED